MCSCLKGDENLRTKRRTQRLTLLMAKVSSTRSGQNLRPRDFMRQINNYGKNAYSGLNVPSSIDAPDIELNPDLLKLDLGG